MDNLAFQAWAKIIRETIWKAIKDVIYQKGEYPEAIIAGGEYAYAIMDDVREIHRTADGGYLWRGITFLRCSAVQEVKIIYDMADVSLPDPPTEK